MKLTFGLILLMMTDKVWSSMGFSFLKTEKDYNSIKIFDDDDRFPQQFSIAKRAATPHDSSPDDKENEIPSFDTQTNGELKVISDYEISTHGARKIELLEEKEPPPPASSGEEDEAKKVSKHSASGEPIIFALANTNVGRSWEGIPYREKYLWGREDGLCHFFDLAVPHEGENTRTISICLYRREVPNKLNSDLLAVPHIAEFFEKKKSVHGYVKGYPKSSVFGHLDHNRFLGEISLGGRGRNDVESAGYVVEDVSVLMDLMGHSPRLLRNLITVMKSANGNFLVDKPNFNGVVTTGKSLRRFASEMSPNPTTPTSQPPFLALSTRHNSFIISGEPTTSVGEKGQTIFSVGVKVITIETDGSVCLRTAEDKEYKFLPNGKSILKIGFNVTNLEENEGPVAVTAVSKTLEYGCILPSLAFSKQRNGGFVCKVCIGMDESFNKNFTISKFNETEMDKYEFLGEMLDRVNWIFRSVDWNGDGLSDDIGINLDPQFFHWDYKDEEKEALSNDELEPFLSTLTNLDFSECCLGLVYTMKRFPGEIFAKASPVKSMTESGVCAIRKDGTSANVILISANSKREPYSSLTSDQLVYLTAHEIGKAFGGSLDATGDAECDSFQDSNGITRHYLLWPDSVRETTQEEMRFSPCAINNIRKALNTCKSACFDIQPESFCGNGIIEEGEECDCGSQLECSKQSCCFSRWTKFPCRNTGYACKEKSSSPANIASIAIILTCNTLSLTLTSKLAPKNFLSIPNV